METADAVRKMNLFMDKGFVFIHKHYIKLNISGRSLIKHPFKLDLFLDKYMAKKEKYKYAVPLTRSPTDKCSFSPLIILYSYSKKEAFQFS